MLEPRSENDLLYFNGINGNTGTYGLPPMSADEVVSQFITGTKSTSDEEQRELGFRQKVGQSFPTRPGVDPAALSQSGWAVIFPAQSPDTPAIREALQPLLDLRRRQVNDETRFRIYAGEDGVQPNESKFRFLRRHQVADGLSDPEQMPYYVLLVGSPEEISFRFQYQLDVQRAVGRLYFDTLDAYANYAQSVVAAEADGFRAARRLTFLGVANPDDRATQLSSAHLVWPLAQKIKQLQELARQSPDLGKQHSVGWDVSALMNNEATKANLQTVLGGPQTPSLLFTASHGMEFNLDDSRQIPHQGAILCQDWAGPKQHRGPLTQHVYFAGDDLTREANLLGLISFHFACYGGGTPQLDEFARQAGQSRRRQIAPRNFMAALPTAMLGRPNAALAVIAHVERAWGYSFLQPGGGPGGNQTSAQTAKFEDVITQLQRGLPVGLATEALNLRYAELATLISTEIEEIDFGTPSMSNRELVGLWTSHNDARSYIILGDPAARLNLAEPGQAPTPRPNLRAQSGGGPLVSVAGATSSGETSGGSGASFAPTPLPSAADIDNYGLRDDLLNGIRNAASQVSQKLAETAQDLTTLDVRTYTTDEDLKNVPPSSGEKGFGQGATLRARTFISLDGDVHSLVPERPADPFDDEAGVTAEIDQELWAIHKEMVGLAQESRVALIKALGEVAGTLTRAFTGR